MRETLERFALVTPDNPPQWRSLYGNINRIGGTVQRDAKVFGGVTVRKPFHSTSRASWRHFAGHFQTTYPKPSRYEK